MIQIKVIIFGNDERIIYHNVEIMDETDTHIILVGACMDLEVNCHKLGEFPYIKIEKRCLVVNEVFVEMDNRKEVISIGPDNISNRMSTPDNRRT